jgi:hypothetical protein
MKIRPVGAESSHADGQTDKRDEAKSLFTILRKHPINCNKNERDVLHNACLMYRLPSGVLYNLVRVCAVDFFFYDRNLVLLNLWVVKLFCVDH